ncbi:hypothetical protein MUP77_01900 [Candidatus Bathyarchaeota archaeon]|nr:hypothetical protein [Candidatus Bathyarchaeota archaeon]
MEDISNPLRLSRDVLEATIETLSLVESDGLDLRAAMSRAVFQLQVKETSRVREARRLAFEILNQKNLLDTILKLVLAPIELGDLKLGVQAFLRIFVFTTRISHSPIKPVYLADLGRRVLGWKELIPVELALGRIAAVNPEETRRKYFGDEGLALRTFNPLWFVKYAIRNFGRQEALEMLSFSGLKGRTFVRANVLRKTESEILENLKSEGIVVEALRGFPNVYEVLDAKKGLRRCIVTGELRLQDLPSTLAVVASNSRPMKNALFVGASPTAEITYLAQLMSNKGTITVLDSSEKRLSRVLADASTAQVSIVKTHLVEDFSTISNVFADTVILHAPSSRTGVFWREPSIKWRTQPGFVDYFKNVQEGLLDIWSEALDAGGNLVYWTTSIAIEEDELVIERFMARHPEFVLAETFPKIGVPGLRGQSQSQRLFPHLNLCDGAFVTRLEKVKNT